ncbi:MAG: CDP-diacylglycerol--glycerol-3-phosphate 3-phosphatidyltransferase [Pirellulales bacterium]
MADNNEQNNDSPSMAPETLVIYNVPNAITMARFVLSILIFVLLPLGMYWESMVVFVIAASTDWMDGYWARKYNQVTQVGRIFDPFVDKIIICGTFIYLAAEDASGILPWMAVVIVGREMLVTVLRSFIEQHGGDFSANMPGKLKMVFQCVAVAASMFALEWPGSESVVSNWYGVTGITPWLQWTLIISVWLAVISTVYSGTIYIFAAADMIKSQMKTDD